MARPRAARSAGESGTSYRVTGTHTYAAAGMLATAIDVQACNDGSQASRPRRGHHRRRTAAPAGPAGRRRRGRGGHRRAGGHLHGRRPSGQQGQRLHGHGRLGRRRDLRRQHHGRRGRRVRRSRQQAAPLRRGGGGHTGGHGARRGQQLPPRGRLVNGGPVARLTRVPGGDDRPRRPHLRHRRRQRRRCGVCLRQEHQHLGHRRQPARLPFGPGGDNRARWSRLRHRRPAVQRLRGQHRLCVRAEQQYLDHGGPLARPSL